MDIILLTIGYPYKNKDVFVGNEISLLSENFQNVYIIPVMTGSTSEISFEDGVILPDNVKVINLNVCKLFYLPTNLNIIRHLIFETRLNLKKQKKVIGTAFRAQAAIYAIDKVYKQYDIKENNVILYSFWAHHNALAIAATNRKSSIKICRAHGYDLYQERGFQPFKSYIFRKLDFIFPCSQMGVDYIKDNYGSKNVEPMYLGSENNFDMSPPIRIKSEFRIISCSRVISIKRIDRIVKSLKLIDDLHIKWVHIGDGALDQIKKQAYLELNNKPNIIYEFLGYLSNNEVIRYYSDFQPNLFINVSSSEGLPVSIMEAASCYIPILATNVGGTREIVLPQNGILINSDFKDIDLASAIKNFITMDEEDYLEMCINSRRVWEKNFNSQSNTMKFIKILKLLVEEKAYASVH